MTIKFIKKKMYSFMELEQRWECSLADLKQAVIEGQLVPSLYFDKANFIEFVFAHFHEHIIPHVSSNGIGEDGFAKPNYIRGFRYLIHPHRNTAFDGGFCFISEKATGFCVGDLCHGLDDDVTIETIVSDGFVLAEEVARVEAAYDHREQETAEKPLGTRERDSLLTIIAVLAKAAKIQIDYSKPGKAAGYIEGLTEELGARLSKRAIEEHLKKIPDALEIRMK